MSKINLKSPILRKIELEYEEFEYPVLTHHYLNEPIIKNSPPFLNVIGNRETKRIFNPLPDEKLSTILWYSARTIRVSNQPKTRWEHRPSPSAGGRHPIDIFVIKPVSKAKIELLLYRTDIHAFAEIKSNSVELFRLMEKAKEILDFQFGTLVWFGAQFDRTLSRYKNGESLVWRDTGFLTSMISLVSESVCVNSCPIGITGEPHFSECLNTDAVIGVGGVCLGDSVPPLLVTGVSPTIDTNRKSRLIYK
jgi:SagB-type dehydrogenase family enzyme